MKNTELTERQVLWGIISGTPQFYIDQKYKRYWLDLVERFTFGEELSKSEEDFIRKTNSAACSARSKAKRRATYDHASARLPRMIRG